MVLALAAALFAAGGTDLVLLFSALGGLSGLAALAGVWVNYRNNERSAEKEDKSVAIVELEKAVPGLGTIIKEWQAVVERLQKDLKFARESATERETELLRHVTELEGELARCLHKDKVEL